jgi:heme ABC exporter ATP-binding subunit CcmA
VDDSRPLDRGRPPGIVATRASQRAQHPIVEISNLKKSYALKPVLRRIDLSMLQGQRVALLGSNGAGKTTLLRILAGLEKPTLGSIRVGGLDVVRDPRRMRQLVGFVAHQPYLYEDLTALENLLFFGRLYNVASARERAMDLLKRVGLERRAKERSSALSRGQVQRLAWARALLHAPALLLLDEPETGLDQEGSALIDTLMAEHHAEGGSILFTTHSLDRALSMSERIVVLGGGRMVSQLESASLTLEHLQQIYREEVR